MARRFYEEHFSLKTDSVGFVQHPDLPWLGASPDALVGPQGCLEIKCPVTLPGEIPAHHEIQCMIQLACTRSTFCDYLAWVPGDFFLFRVWRDLVKEYVLLMELWKFYTQFVQADTEPPRYKRRPTSLPWDAI